MARPNVRFGRTGTCLVGLCCSGALRETVLGTEKVSDH